MLSLEPKEVASIAVGGFGALQKHEELALLLAEVDKLQPKVILEIGLGKGGTLWAWSKISSVKHIISLDLPGGAWGGEEFPRTSATLQYIKNNCACEISFIGGDSHDAAVIDKVKEVLNGEKIDFLLIDGDHSYEGVKKDYVNFSQLVRPGGLIAFHDYCNHAPETKCEVRKFCDEIKDSVSHEIFEVEPKTWGGIMLVRK